jgi:hypothetical protein
MLQALNTKSFLYETGDCMLHQATMGLASPLSTSGQSDPRWRPASSAGSLQSRFICGKHSVPAACFKGPAGRREGRSTRRRGTPRAAEPSAHAGPQSRSPQAAPQSPPHLSLATRGILQSQTNTALWWSRAGPLHTPATLITVICSPDNPPEPAEQGRSAWQRHQPAARSSAWPERLRHTCRVGYVSYYALKMRTDLGLSITLTNACRGARLQGAPRRRNASTTSVCGATSACRVGLRSYPALTLTDACRRAHPAGERQAPPACAARPARAAWPPGRRSSAPRTRCPRP